MSQQVQALRRRRSSTATRAAILDAAKARFMQQSYENVGIRDIAGDVGVDPALVSRYVGSKEDLFAEVLGTCAGAHEIWQGDWRTFGVRVTRILLDEPLDSTKLDAVLIMLRSASSPAAASVIRKSISSRFSAPATAYLGDGPDAEVFSNLIGSLLMGSAIQRAIKGSTWLSDPDDRALYAEHFARMLQSLVDTATASPQKAAAPRA